LQALKSDKLIRFEDDVVEMRDDARFLVRTVAAAFDAQLRSVMKTYSRAI